MEDYNDSSCQSEIEEEETWLPDPNSDCDTDSNGEEMDFEVDDEGHFYLAPRWMIVQDTFKVNKSESLVISESDCEIKMEKVSPSLDLRSDYWLSDGEEIDVEVDDEGYCYMVNTKRRKTETYVIPKPESQNQKVSQN